MAPERGPDRRPSTSLGAAGETAAVRFLTRAGFTIVARNLRSRMGEIDILARDGPTLVFVEVKARRGISGDPPQAAVDARKRARLARLALGYLAAHRLGGRACRFDVVAVTLTGDGRLAAVRHIEGAFGFDGWTA